MGESRFLTAWFRATVLLVPMLCLLFGGLAGAEESTIIPGAVTIKAGADAIVLRADVMEIGFAQTPSGAGDTGVWIGEGLRVTSVRVRGDSSRTVADSAQLEGIRVVSDVFRKLLVNVHVHSLRRVFERFVPADTLIISPATGERRIGPNLSLIYHLEFPESIPVDTVIQRLRRLPEIMEVSSCAKITTIENDLEEPFRERR